MAERREDEIDGSCEGDAPGHGEPTALGGAMLPDTAALGHEGQGSYCETIPSKTTAPAHDSSVPVATALSVTAAPGHGGQDARRRHVVGTPHRD